jgi:hypothetical protein
MTNPTPEQIIQALDRLKMTPEERNAERIGKYLADIILIFFAPTIIWLALVYLIGFEIAWAKVFGIYFIFNFLKNIIVISFKK